MRTELRVIRVLLFPLVVFCLFGDDCVPLAPSGIGTGGPTATPTPITATISASQVSNIQPGTNVTFTANASGGTPPYTYFWIMDNEAAFTESGPDFTRQIDGSAPRRTVTLVVRDSTNTDSPYFSLDVTLADQLTPAVNTVCGDMSGTWNSAFGAMHLTQTGNTVSGPYDYFCPGFITGTLFGGPAASTACPDCQTWSGTWSESGPGCDPASGTFSFSVDPDLGHFNGTWTKDPNTHPQADFWSGDHDTCRDGSPAGPRQ